MPKKLELIGSVFGKLTVLSEDGTDSFGATMWRCRCECGAAKSVRGAQLKSGAVRSCGCGVAAAAKVNNTTHGASRTPLFRRWQAMLARCSNKRSKSFKNYGARGITVCERWLDFQSFSDDMAATFREELELERVDTDGNYEPSNCCWATVVQQQRNRRNNHRLTINGETLTLVEWEERSGVKANTILTRVRRGWPPSRLLEIANQ